MLEQLDVTTAFDNQIPVPAISDLGELEAVLGQVGAFDGRHGRIVQEIERATGSREVNVGIKTVLTSLETAKLSESPEEWFVEQISGQIARYPGV